MFPELFALIGRFWDSLSGLLINFWSAKNKWIAYVTWLLVTIFWAAKWTYSVMVGTMYYVLGELRSSVASAEGVVRPSAAILDALGVANYVFPVQETFYLLGVYILLCITLVMVRTVTRFIRGFVG